MYDRGIFFNSEVWAFIGIWAFIIKIVTIKKKHQLAGAGRGGVGSLLGHLFLGKLFQKSPEPAWLCKKHPHTFLFQIPDPPLIRLIIDLALSCLAGRHFWLKSSVAQMTNANSFGTMSQITIMFVSPLSSDRWGFRRYGSLLLCHWVTVQ